MHPVVPRLVLLLALAALAACGGVIQPAATPPSYGGGRSSGFQ